MSADEVRAIITHVVGSGVPLQGVSLVIVFFVVLVASAISGVAGSYLRRKGENLATREDIAKITKATEEIKAQISAELWVQQTRWNLKRDIYTRLLENLGEAADALDKLWTSAERPYPGDEEGRMRHRQWEEALKERESKAVDEIRRATSVAAIMLGDTALAALHKLQAAWAAAEAADNYGDYLDRQTAAVGGAYKLLVASAKEDLRL